MDGAPHAIASWPSLPNAGEADGISANDQFVVGSHGYDASFNEGGWRWNRADNSVIQIPDMVFAFAVSNDGKTIIGNAGYGSGPLAIPGSGDAGYRNSAISDTTYDARTALIWQEGIGTMRLVDWITANGGTIPADWNADLAGSAINMTGDATSMSGWSASSTAISYTVTVTPDKLFSDDFDGTSLGVFATLSPSVIPAQNAQGAPATLTIDLDDPGKSDATLTAFRRPASIRLDQCRCAERVQYLQLRAAGRLPGYDTITLHASAVIPAGAHCVISLAVTANLSGTYQNVIPAGSLLIDAGSDQVDSHSSVTVLAGGNGVVHSPTLNYVMVDSSTGSSVNWVTGTFSDTGPTSGAFDLNLRDTTNLTFRTVKTYQDGLAVDTSNNVLLMHTGDVVGPSTYFTYAATASGFVTPAAWLAGGNGYIGFRFQCDKPRQANQVAGGFCYGYAHLQTTAGATGYPVTLVELCLRWRRQGDHGGTVRRARRRSVVWPPPPFKPLNAVPVIWTAFCSAAQAVAQMQATETIPSGVCGRAVLQHLLFVGRLLRRSGIAHSPARRRARAIAASALACCPRAVYSLACSRAQSKS